MNRSGSVEGEQRKEGKNEDYQEEVGGEGS